METETILWRCLEAAGHDACSLAQRDDGWRLTGAAVFQHEGAPACLTYGVDCDGEWRSREGVVHGWVGARPVNFRITRAPDGVWLLNDQAVHHLVECIDLDLGFTPATNLFHLRRLNLQVGQAAIMSAAWLDVFAGTLETLQQRYERRTQELYWYEAPRFGYFAHLQVNTAGFVEKYPNLWEKEP